MDNRFGLKDAIFLVLLLAIGVTLVTSMFQKDRMWEQLRRIESKVDETRTRVENVANETKTLAAAPRAAATPSNNATSTPTTASGARDESWARPGVPIEWQPPLAFSTDPATQPGFREGGEFTEIWEGKCARVTPFLSTDVYGRRVLDLVCDSLGAYNPKTLKFEGILADAWQYSPDGTWLRVHLRPEATFSDGKPVTAEDVRFTFKDYILNSLIEAESARSILDMIADVKVIDDRTVEFQFSKVLFSNLSGTLNNYVLPKHFYEKFEPSQINQSTSLLMGSGQFRLAKLDPSDQWSPGSDLVIVRNEQYWAKNRRPVLASMRFKTIQDDRARLVAYRNGEGDLITPTSPQFVEVQKESDFEKANRSMKWFNMRSGYSFVAWQTGKRKGERLTPFHDKRVRQAMTMLLNREQMIQEIWSGIGMVAKSPFNPESPAANPDLKPWPFDLDRAKALLAEAGWKDRDGDGLLENEQGDPFEFEFTLAQGGDIVDRIANFMKNACLKAGIKCNVRLIDWAVYTDMYKARDFDALTMAWQSSAPESDLRQMFHSDSIKGGGQNFMQWSNKKADELLEKGIQELDFDKRMKIWHELAELLHDEQPYTFIRVVPWIRFSKKDIGNVQMYKTGLEPWEFFREAVAQPAS
ncbi:MAG: hypothetical protein JNM94_04150 [Phycisphaerae bacterium]|nr:hypothetical protein [Phycisphaerae bacterium]